jgi:hypothetical protein
MTGGAAPNFPTASELPLLGSNQDSPDPEGGCNGLNSSNLQQFSRVRVTRCWCLLGVDGLGVVSLGLMSKLTTLPCSAGTAGPDF